MDTVDIVINVLGLSLLLAMAGRLHVASRRASHDRMPRTSTMAIRNFDTESSDAAWIAAHRAAAPRWLRGAVAGYGVAIVALVWFVTELGPGDRTPGVLGCATAGILNLVYVTAAGRGAAAARRVRLAHLDLPD